MTDEGDDRRVRPRDQHESVVTLLTESQPALRTHLTIILGNPHVAENVLQETNLVIWRKAAEFEPGSNFGAWARKIAYWQARAYLRDASRDPHVFGTDLLPELQVHGIDLSAESDVVHALRECLQRVNKRDLDLLLMRYREEVQTKQIAEVLGLAESSVRSRLSRLRLVLRRCVEAKVQLDLGGIST